MSTHDTIASTPARRLALGVDKWLALQAAAEDAGIELPADIRIDVPEGAAATTGFDLEGGLADARRQLAQHGVLDAAGAPVPAVAANLSSVVGAASRLRVSLAGPAGARLGYFWTGGQLGGALVRSGSTHTLSLFTATDTGAEVAGMLPEGVPERPDEDPLTVPLDAVGPVTSAPDLPDTAVPTFAEVTGTPEDDVRRLRTFGEQNRAVLSVTALGAERPAYALVWFLGTDGWWAGRTTGEGEGRRLTLTPSTQDDLRAAIAALLTEAWA